MHSFVHLHVHTEYSLLDGAARIKGVIKKAKDMGMTSLAITDHGVMFGVVDFYKACQKEGIKPILGCEVYVAPRTRHDRTPKIDDNLYHLVLLAENETGYKNLLNLVSLGFTEGFYYKPRVDKEILARYNEGLIALSGCIAGEVARYILQDAPDKARRSASEYLNIFGSGNYFLEIQDHGFAEQKKVNRELIEISKELNIPLVATNDVHYVSRENAEMQDVLLCIQTGKTVDDPGRMKFQSQELYLKSPEEMAQLFGDVPGALENTVEIASRCEVRMEFGKLHLPYYRVPEGHTVESYLRELCEEGLNWRYKGSYGKDVRERLEYELSVIEQMGYSAYFLIVWDFIHFARNNGVPVGPGRGSAAGSLVAYVLGITNLDPLKYDLLFERFLNPERVSMPDIDVDICYERRNKVIEYVVQKYGEDRVAQIATFGTMAARAAIRDVGRALAMPYGEVDKVAKLVPAELKMTIEKALNESPDLKELYEREPEIRKLIDTARGLEGMPRHASIHAAGVVITKEPLTHYLPLYKSTDGPVSTQFAKEPVEELGLLKMDLLGLRTLTVISDAVDMINRRINPPLDIEQIPLDDKNTYELLCRGEGVGVFQLESSGMRAILRDLRPEVFEDIVALVALYRPGPLGSGMVDDFIKNKHGLKEVVYLHPILEPILRDTYGVILYQEQVMRISSDLAGFSLGEADLLRRAMGKKKPEVIAGLRSQFLEGAKKKNVDPEIAGKVFDLMEYFAGYGFNKSHSAAYALVSYQTAYLKANYPVEYMAALLTSVKDNSDKVALFIEECRRMGIEVLPPDVNESGEGFTVVDGKIRFGMSAMKNVGLAAVQSIIKVREEGGPFTGFGDFCQRLDTKVVNRRVLESLIKGGAFDSLGHRRAQLMAVVDVGLSMAQQAQRDRNSGQVSLFDFMEENESSSLSLTLPDISEFPYSEMLALEKEALGLYISGHPLAEYREVLAGMSTVNNVEVHEYSEGEIVSLGGLIVSLKQINTKKGDPMAFVNLEDLTGTIEVIVFPRVYKLYRQLLQPDAVVLVKGKVNGSGEEVKIIAEEISFPVKQVSGDLYLQFINFSMETVHQVQLILQTYPGSSPVFLYFPEEKKLAKTSKKYWVNLDSPVIEKLEELLGPNNVKIKQQPLEKKVIVS
ncbi:DNA polymerase III subunit alpha [Desulfolucanica intricata]|uniref:DNA polymerase III subunit alpha n=1 Tax=Desulfolucanica intricata TaxID=1285191 RepID=UPI003F76CB46